MHTFSMKIRDKYINSIKNGVKTREYRLNNDERKQINIGDILVLVSNDDKASYVRTKVTSVSNYKTWTDALLPYWESDFKGIYNSLDEALDDCYHFYSKKEVDQYGIVVFGIKAEHFDLKASFVLLDTNIIIQRESFNNADFGVSEAYKWMDTLKCNKLIHPSSKGEIAKYENQKIRDNLLTKLESYQEIKPEQKEDPFFKIKISCFPINENSIVDNDLLFQVYCGLADFLITNDREMWRKAEALFIRQKVLSVSEFLNEAERENPSLIEYKMLHVRSATFGDVDFGSCFFDSLKKNYNPGFDEWFAKKRKANEPCYIYTDETGLKGFLYIKTEEQEEKYTDINPLMPKKKRLKVGTFKIVSTGVRVGERFLKIIFDNAKKRDVDEIYVTLFENRSADIDALRDLLMKWGFSRFGKKENGETVMTKDMRSYDDAKSPKMNFPLTKREPNYFFLPIMSDYHTDLFPDSVIHGEDVTIYEKEKAHRYSLEKVYVSNYFNVPAVSGDILVIYRMGEFFPKKYSSVITGTAIFEGSSQPTTEEEYLSECKNITVFNEEQLKTFYSVQKYRTVIKLLALSSFDRKITLNDLQIMGIVSEESGARLFSRLTEEHFESIMSISRKGE